jgi:hypothetical protein
MEDAVARGRAGGVGLNGWAGGTRRVGRAVRGRSVRRVGHTGTQGVRAYLARLDRWVQMMDLGSITLGDE